MRPIVVFVLIMVVMGVAEPQVKERSPLNALHTLSEGVVWRKSDNRNPHGGFLPPWTEVSITNLFGFKRKPVIGDLVTVVPIGADIPAFELRILNAKPTENPCDKRLGNWWEVELDRVNQTAVHQAGAIAGRSPEFPFDVVVIYPSVRFAREIARDQLNRQTLPKRVTVQTVKAAIDVTADRIPDIVVTSYCCQHPTKPPGERCNYTCGKTFGRVGKIWKLFDTSAPC